MPSDEPGRDLAVPPDASVAEVVYDGEVIDERAAAGVPRVAPARSRALPERWLPVPGWPYEASSRGHIRSLARGVPLKPSRDKDGYRYVELSDGRRRRRVHVAVLVLEAFDKPCPPGMEALHKNGRRWDNRAANLRWGTKAENRADRERHRRQRLTRAARRAAVVPGFGVTGANERETAEIDGAPSCRLETGEGVSAPC